MRKPTTWRPAAIGAAFALLGAALVPGVASAAEIYHPDVVLGTEDAESDRGYPDGIWFAGSASTGTQTQTDDGLTVTSNTRLLYGAAETPLTGAGFVAPAQDIDVDADGPWSLQLSVYLDNENAGLFTTYRPAQINTTPGELTSEWISTWPTLNHGKNASLTLQQISDEIDGAIAEGHEPALLAFGVLVDDGWDPLTLRSFTIDGDTHFFTPEPDPEDDGKDEPVGPQPVPNPVTLPSKSPFTDASATGTQFYKEVTWLADTGVANGWNMGGGKYEFRPYDEISRSAMAAFLYRYNLNV